MDKIKPMLAMTGSSDDLLNNDMIFELKMDGTRCICYKNGSEVKFLNRRGVWFEHRFPEIVSGILKNVKAKKAILDGEVYVPNKKGNPDFGKLAQRDHLENTFRINILSKQLPAIYAVFDIISLDGEDLTGLPLLERKKALEKIVNDSENVKKVYYTHEGRKLWDAVKKMKLEGVMAKKKDSKYLEGLRTYDWLKIKVLRSLDLIIVGYSTSISQRGIGSIITGCYYKNNLIYTGKVGTGLTDKGWNELLGKLEKIRIKKYPFEDEVDLELPNERTPIWVRQDYVCEVKFMKLTKNNQMRAPSFIRLREDKEAKDCKLEYYFTRQA